MKDLLSSQYIDRLRAGLRPDLTSLVRYITEETYINLKPFSFVGHEYQQYFTELIEKDPDIDITAEKCSQIGLSEVCFRIVLGKMALVPGYSVIYAMPSKTFAQEVLKTRMAPIIESSPSLKALICHDVDSASVKMFKNGSIMFALGASSNSSQSLINRPVTLALTDELDKCDMKIHSGFRSRQTHSKHKPRIAISTPTAPGIGINGQAEGRQLHYQVLICAHCNREFLPDYYEQVKVPGFNEPISLLNMDKVRAKNLDIKRAYHHCPYCHAKVQPDSKYRQWVVEDSHRTQIHVRFTPFAAPDFISAADLVTSQLTYSNRAEFDNQSLGLPSQLSDSSITREIIKFVDEETPDGIQVAGMDIGKESNYLQATFKNGVLFVHSPELIPVGELKERVRFNIKTQNIVSMVADNLPFLDVINSLTNEFPMFWGALYNVPKQPEPELYKMKINEEEQVRQLRIQKNLFMDHVAGMIAAEQIVFQNGPFAEQMVQHFTDMRRVRDYEFSDLRYKWIKSNSGLDHWWHTLVYLVCASKVIEKSSSSHRLPMGMMLKSFKMKKDL